MSRKRSAITSTLGRPTLSVPGKPQQHRGTTPKEIRVQLAPGVTELAQEVIAQSGSWEGKAYAYKITADGFPRFRATFERRLMTRLVGFAEDALHARLVDTAGNVQEETVQFITNPAVFSMICGEICDGVYEYLCNEGFLDMPADYRAAQQNPAAA